MNTVESHQNVIIKCNRNQNNNNYKLNKYHDNDESYYYIELGELIIYASLQKIVIIMFFNAAWCYFIATVLFYCHNRFITTFFDQSFQNF